jgi:diguanylate cyclase
MAVADSAPHWWTGLVRTVLPQRGALANARDAVQHDRWAAAQRRDAVLGAARVAAGPFDSLTGSGGRDGLPDEQARDRVVDLVAHEEFASAAEEALLGLQERLGLDLWLVAAVDDDKESLVAARQLPDLPLPTEAVGVWALACCRLIVTGQAPRVAPRVGEVLGREARVATGPWQLAAYVGVPLLAADGTLLGTLCGVSGREQPDSLAEGLADVERVARLLSTILVQELAAQNRARAMAEAYALAERDPLTGLMNRQGWETRLRVEEQRCRRHGRAASVLVIDFDAGLRGAARSRQDQRQDQLRAAADLLTCACRGEDTLARPDARQLSVLVVECDSSRAAGLAERLQELLGAAGLPAAVGVAARTRTHPLLEAWDQALEQVQRAAPRAVAVAVERQR